MSTFTPEVDKLALHIAAALSHIREIRQVLSLGPFPEKPDHLRMVCGCIEDQIAQAVALLPNEVGAKACAIYTKMETNIDKELGNGS